MTDKPFTIADALKIQTEDMERWKLVLNKESYVALNLHVQYTNGRGYESPYDVIRGQMLTTFVNNLSYQLHKAA